MYRVREMAPPRVEEEQRLTSYFFAYGEGGGGAVGNNMFRNRLIGVLNFLFSCLLLDIFCVAMHTLSII